MSNTATENNLSYADKVALYLEAHGDRKITDYKVCGEGLCWKDSSGRFTIKTRLYYTVISTGEQKVAGYKQQLVNGEKVPLSRDEAFKNQLYKHLRRQGIFACNRCGGAGGSAHWPGFTCYDCGGDGIDHSINIEHELNEFIAGRDFAGDYVAKAKAKAEADRIERDRLAKIHEENRARQLREFLANNQDRFNRCRAALSFLGLEAKGQWAEEIRGFLWFEHNGQVCGDGAIAQLDKVLDRVEARQADNERQAAFSGWIGKVGERAEFKARVTFTKSFESGFGERHLTVLADEAGNVIKYWNHIQVTTPEGKRPAEKGEQITFSAGIKAHDEYQGVKQTTIQRATKGALV